MICSCYYYWEQEVYGIKREQGNCVIEINIQISLQVQTYFIWHMQRQYALSYLVIYVMEFIEILTSKEIFY